jgi:hypothetical protein
MAGADTGFFQGTGGGVWEMSLPLPADLEKQLARQELRRVNGPDDASDYDPAAEPRRLTAKEQLQVDAGALGLDTSGTVAELTARIDAKVAELLTQAKELGIDGDKLSGPELLAAVDAKLAE